MDKVLYISKTYRAKGEKRECGGDGNSLHGFLGQKRIRDDAYGSLAPASTTEGSMVMLPSLLVPSNEFLHDFLYGAGRIPSLSPQELQGQDAGFNPCHVQLASKSTHPPCAHGLSTGILEECGFPDATFSEPHTSDSMANVWGPSTSTKPPLSHQSFSDLVDDIEWYKGAGLDRSSLRVSLAEVSLNTAIYLGGEDPWGSDYQQQPGDLQPHAIREDTLCFPPVLGSRWPDRGVHLGSNIDLPSNEHVYAPASDDSSLYPDADSVPMNDMSIMVNGASIDNQYSDSASSRHARVNLIQGPLEGSEQRCLRQNLDPQNFFPRVFDDEETLGDLESVRVFNTLLNKFKNDPNATAFIKHVLKVYHEKMAQYRERQASVPFPCAWQSPVFDKLNGERKVCTALVTMDTILDHVHLHFHDFRDEENCLWAGCGYRDTASKVLHHLKYDHGALELVGWVRNDEVLCIREFTIAGESFPAITFKPYGRSDHVHSRINTAIGKAIKEVRSAKSRRSANA